MVYAPTTPCLFRSSGMCATPSSVIFRGVIRVASRPRISTCPPTLRRMPTIASTSSRCPLPSTPATPKISPPADLDREAVDGLDHSFVLHPQVADAQHRLAGRGRGLLDLEHDIAPDHEVGERLLRRRRRVGGAGDPAVAQNRDAVGDGEHLAQLVGDEHDRLALIDQAADHGEEVVDLARRQHGGGLVEDQDVGLAEQRLDQLDALLLADGEVADLGVGVDPQAIPVAELADAPPRFVHVEQRPLDELVAEDHVLRHGEHRDQLEMLVHHADPVVDGVVHTIEADVFATDPDRPSIGLVEAEHHVHQRALAGTVLAQQAVDLALVEDQVDVLVGDHTWKRLGDAPDLEHRRPLTLGAHVAASPRRSPGDNSHVRRRAATHTGPAPEGTGPVCNLFRERSVAGRPFTEEQAVDAADAGLDASVGESGSGCLDGRLHLVREIRVVWFGVGDEVVRRGPDDEAAFELILDRVGDQTERDEVDALDRRAGEELRAGRGRRRRTS